MKMPTVFPLNSTLTSPTFTTLSVICMYPAITTVKPPLKMTIDWLSLTGTSSTTTSSRQGTKGTHHVGVQTQNRMALDNWKTFSPSKNAPTCAVRTTNAVRLPTRTYSLVIPTSAGSASAVILIQRASAQVSKILNLRTTPFTMTTLIGSSRRKGSRTTRPSACS